MAASRALSTIWAASFRERAWVALAETPLYNPAVLPLLMVASCQSEPKSALYWK